MTINFSAKDISYSNIFVRRLRFYFCLQGAYSKFGMTKRKKKQNGEAVAQSSAGSCELFLLWKTVYFILFELPFWVTREVLSRLGTIGLLFCTHIFIFLRAIAKYTGASPHYPCLFLTLLIKNDPLIVGPKHSFLKYLHTNEFTTDVQCTVLLKIYHANFSPYCKCMILC